MVESGVVAGLKVQFPAPELLETSNVYVLMPEEAVVSRKFIDTVLPESAPATGRNWVLVKIGTPPTILPPHPLLTVSLYMDADINIRTLLFADMVIDLVKLVPV